MSTQQLSPALVAPSTQDESNTIKVPLTPIACWRVDDIRYEFDSSFILPDASQELTKLSVLMRQHTGAVISIFGHADPVGSEDYNKKLSGRRAAVIYAMLTRNTDIWEDIYNEPAGGDNWGTKSIQIMLEDLGYSPGLIDGVMGNKTKEALKKFQKDNGLPATGNLNRQTRTQLFLAYMDKNCQDENGAPFKLEKTDFLAGGTDPKGKGDYQGCSEYNPLLIFSKKENKEYSLPKNKSKRDFENVPNRRVEVFLFQPGSRVDTKSWPCPNFKEGVPGCKKRFWSDAGTRRSFQEDRREYRKTKDTFACRFYERITRYLSCEQGQPSLNTRVILHWSKNEIVPDHNVNWPPNNPPNDDVPDEAMVSIIVETQNVPDGTGAAIEIRHAHTEALVKDGTISGLQVKNNRVIDPLTDEPPVWVFRALHVLWDPWDKPFYYFVAKINHEGLTGETPRDYTNQSDKVLRLLYWHISVSDAVADTPAGGGLTTQEEMNEIAGMQSSNPHRKIYTIAFNQNNVPVGLWGSVVRNSYNYHHSSHGAVECRVHPGTYFDSTADSLPTTCPINSADPGRSVFVIGNTNFGDTEVNQVGGVPSVPRYLAYFNTCAAGWETSLANALIARGMQNVLAFRKYIPDGDAREMARQFYRKWCQIYKCDPEKIPHVFFSISPAYYDSMRPVLFGTGGGSAYAATAGTASAITNTLAAGAKV